MEGLKIDPAGVFPINHYSSFLFFGKKTILVLKFSKLSFFGPCIFKLLIILDHAVIPLMENPTWLMDYTASLKIMFSVSEMMEGTKLMQPPSILRTDN